METDFGKDTLILIRHRKLPGSEGLRLPRGKACEIMKDGEIKT